MDDKNLNFVKYKRNSKQRSHTRGQVSSSVSRYSPHSKNWKKGKLKQSTKRRRRTMRQYCDLNNPNGKIRNDIAYWAPSYVREKPLTTKTFIHTI